MSSFFPNGTIYSISTAFAAAVAVASISNAAPAVAAVSGSTIADGDIVVVNSAWALLSGQVRRAIAASATEVGLEGTDTTDLVKYPAGVDQGAGSLLKVESWMQLNQVRESTFSGGDQNFFQWQYLEDPNSLQRQRPTYKGAMSIALTLDYDDQLPWYQALIDADRRGEVIVLWAHLPNGADLYYAVLPSFNPEPTQTMNENMTVSGTFSLQGLSTRYRKA